jgi:anti-sigma factor RsiW
MMAVDSAMLHAFLDGELDDETARQVETALASDPALRAELEAQRRLRARLSAHFDPALDEPVPARFQALLAPKVVDLAAVRENRRSRMWLMPMAMAASLVLGLAIGQFVPRGGGAFGTADGALVARGPLAEALDTQLASAQPGDATTRIGVSFARADGSLCRTFASAGTSGLACREGDDWRMIATAAAGAAQRGDFRQAGSDSPIVLRAAQDLMAGEPLDDAAERRARDSGWRGPGHRP